MVKIYSPTGSEGSLVSFLVEWAREHGFTSYRDMVGNFIAERGTGKEVLLVGHVDTVPGEIPFKTEDNVLYGRGAVDAKGALACFLEAASSADLRNRIVVVGAVDEEGESRGARHLLSGFNPSCIIIGEPSGWDSITLGYKGRFHIEYEDIREKIHSSLESFNSIEEAIVFINRIRRFCDSYNANKSMFHQLGMKIEAIHSDTDGFTDSSQMRIIFRIPLGFQKRRLKRVIETHKGQAQVQYSLYEPPVKTSKKNGLVSAFLRSIRSLDGVATFKVKSGTSDMNILQAFKVPIVAYGPGNSRYDHTPHEHLDLEEYEKSVTVMKKVLQALQA